MKKTSLIQDVQSLLIAEETIAFQSGKFGAELENFIEDTRKRYSKAQDFIESKTSGKISEIIKKHTNMLVNVDIDYLSVYFNIGPAIVLPSLSSNHLFVQNYIKPYSDKTTSERFIKSLQTNAGRNGVDLKSSKVFGVFEDIEVKMLLSAEEIINDFQTPQEIVSTILHEIGHLFTYFEYFNRTVTTNQVLTNLCESLEEENDNGIRQNLIQQAAIAVRYKEDLPKELLEETDSRKIAIQLMRYTYTMSETGSYKYDESNCETLADQFAVRYGYGLALATSLYKISPKSRSESKIQRAAIYASETVSLLLKVTTKAVISGGVVGGVIGISGGAVATSMLIGALTVITAFSLIALSSTIYETTDTTHNGYDTFPTRLKKVKEQLIQSTRVKTKKPEELKKIVSQIEAIELLIKYSLDKGYLLRTIADFIRPSNRGSAASIILNRRLEELASNDLFVGAAKLKTLI